MDKQVLKSWVYCIYDIDYKACLFCNKNYLLYRQSALSYTLWCYRLLANESFIYGVDMFNNLVKRRVHVSVVWKLPSSWCLKRSAPSACLRKIDIFCILMYNYTHTTCTTHTAHTLTHILNTIMHFTLLTKWMNGKKWRLEIELVSGSETVIDIEIERQITRCFGSCSTVSGNKGIQSYC